MRITTIAISLLAAACGTDSPSNPPPAGILEPPPDGQGIQLSLHHTLAAGEEVHWCQYFALDTAIDVAKFEHAYTQGSHHVLAYTTPLHASDVAGMTDFSCEGGTGETYNGVAYAGAVPTGELAFPADVGFHFDAGSVILLEGHYLDATDGALDAEVAVNLWFAAAPPSQQAGTLFFYDNNIYVPANGDYTAQMTCEVSHDINVVSLLSHMHSRGVHYHAEIAGAPALTLIDTDQWLNPEPMLMTTPLVIRGGSRVDYSCDYHDTTGTAVMEGPSKTKNEMCMLIGAYWPRMDFGHELCAAPGSGSIYDGTATCGQALGCLMSTADPLAAEQCYTHTCAASSQPLDDFQSCVFASCIAPGTCTGPDCGSCALAMCGPQINACQAATCN
jgi:hypothetical protein